MSEAGRADILAEVTAAQGGGPPVALATVIQAPPDGAVPVGAKLLLRQDGSTLGSLDGGPLEAAVLASSRRELCAATLIVYRRPLYQVLSLEDPAAGPPAVLPLSPRRRSGDAISIGEVLRQAIGGES